MLHSYHLKHSPNLWRTKTSKNGNPSEHKIASHVFSAEPILKHEGKVQEAPVFLAEIFALHGSSIYLDWRGLVNVRQRLSMVHIGFHTFGVSSISKALTDTGHIYFHKPGNNSAWVSHCIEHPIEFL